MNLFEKKYKTKLIPGTIGLLSGMLGAVFLFRSLFAAPSINVFWSGNFDPNLIYWIMEWGYHILFEKWDWWEFWNANQFFPWEGSLAFSESFISAQIVYGPLRLFGLDPLPAMYCTFAVFTVVGCMLSDWALVRIGNFKAHERAIIIYVAHFSLPMTTFLGHYQFFGFQLVPPFFLLFYLLLRGGGGAYLVLSALLFALTTGFSNYFAPMSIGVILCFAILFTFQRRLHFYLVRIYSSVGWKSIAATILIGIGLFWVQFKPYLDLFDEVSKPDWNGIALVSARPWSFFLHPSLRSWLYPSPQITWGYWEKCYFPGILLIIATIICIVKLLKEAKKAPPKSERSSIVISFTHYAMALFVISYLLSWGPFFRIEMLGVKAKIYLPFAILAKILPGFENVRTPGRFGMFLGLPLGVFAVIAMRQLFLSRAGTLLGRKSSAGVYLLLMVGIILDNGLQVQTFPFSIAYHDFYETTQRMIDDHEPTLVLPLAKEKHIDMIANFMEQLKGGTIHHGWIVAGYGARSTPELKEFTKLDRQIQRGKLGFKSIMELAREIKVRKLVVFKEYYSDNQLSYLKNAKGLRIMYSSNDGLLCEILPNR